jgi:hypothetical protein
MMLHHVLAVFAFALVLAAAMFRESRSDRADLGWLMAAIVAICLVAMTEQTPPRGHAGARHVWNDLGVSAARR